MHGGHHGHPGAVKWGAIILGHLAVIIVIVYLLGFGPKIHQAIFGHLPDTAAHSG